MIEAVAAVAALVFVPGAGASLALAAPGAISVEGRIALAFGLGYGLVAGLATLLALAHAFSRPTFTAGVVLATIAVWVLALRRAPARTHAAALVRQVREEPFVLAAGLALLLAVAVTRPLYPAEASLAVRSTWRYWADGLEVAAAGHVPTVAPQWGIEIPATVSKVVFNVFEGGVSLLLGPEPLPAMHAIFTVVAIGFVAALLGLARELGLGLAAPLVPALFVLVPDGFPLSQEIAREFKLFTAENVGRMAAFSAVIVGIYALRGRERWVPAVVCGALLAAAGLSHLVPTMVAGAVLALFGVAYVLVNRGRLGTSVARGAIVALVFGVAYVGTLALSGGDLGLQRATSGGQFAGLPAEVDPTLSFSHGRYVDREPTTGSFFIPPRELVGRYAEDTFDRPNHGKIGVGLLALLGLATAVAVWFDRRLFIAAAVAWGLAGTILAVAFLFSFRYDTLIPANFGVRRLYDYVVVPPALLLPLLVEAIARPLARRTRIVAPAVALAVAAVAVGFTVGRLPGDRSLGRAEAGKEVFARVAEYVPCDARMLANTRTAGSWEAWTGRLAVTEGMSPFLRPEVMGRILPILVEANEFFRHPQENVDFLEEQRVDYLVVVSPGVWFGWGGTGRNPQPDDADRIAALPGVRELFRGERVAIFAVGAQEADASGGQPDRCPLPV
jgi:hypothetical protein